MISSVKFLEVKTSTRFEKDVTRLKRRGKELEKLEILIKKLQYGHEIERKHRPHLLSGDWEGYWDLHVEPDWILIYQITEDALYLVRSGTHADLF